MSSEHKYFRDVCNPSEGYLEIKGDESINISSLDLHPKTNPDSIYNIKKRLRRFKKRRLYSTFSRKKRMSSYSTFKKDSLSVLPNERPQTIKLPPRLRLKLDNKKQSSVTPHLVTDNDTNTERVNQHYSVKNLCEFKLTGAEGSLITSSYTSESGDTHCYQTCAGTAFNKTSSSHVNSDRHSKPFSCSSVISLQFDVLKDKNESSVEDNAWKLIPHTVSDDDESSTQFLKKDSTISFSQDKQMNFPQHYVSENKELLSKTITDTKYSFVSQKNDSSIEFSIPSVCDQANRDTSNNALDNQKSNSIFASGSTDDLNLDSEYAEMVSSLCDSPRRRKKVSTLCSQNPEKISDCASSESDESGDTSVHSCGAAIASDKNIKIIPDKCNDNNSSNKSTNDDIVYCNLPNSLNTFSIQNSKLNEDKNFSSHLLESLHEIYSSVKKFHNYENFQNQKKYLHSKKQIWQSVPHTNAEDEDSDSDLLVGLALLYLGNSWDTIRRIFDFSEHSTLDNMKTNMYDKYISWIHSSKELITEIRDHVNIKINRKASLDLNSDTKTCDDVLTNRNVSRQDGVEEIQSPIFHSVTFQKQSASHLCGHSHVSTETVHLTNLEVKKQSKVIEDLPPSLKTEGHKNDSENYIKGVDNENKSLAIKSCSSSDPVMKHKNVSTDSALTEKSVNKNNIDSHGSVYSSNTRESFQASKFIIKDNTITDKKQHQDFKNKIKAQSTQNFKLKDTIDVIGSKSLLDIQKDVKQQESCLTRYSQKPKNKPDNKASSVKQGVVPTFSHAMVIFDESALAIPVLNGQSVNKTNINSNIQNCTTNVSVAISTISYEDITPPPPLPITMENDEDKEVVKYFRSGTYNVPTKRKPLSRNVSLPVPGISSSAVYAYGQSVSSGSAYKSSQCKEIKVLKDKSSTEVITHNPSIKLHENSLSSRSSSVTQISNFQKLRGSDNVILGKNSEQSDHSDVQETDYIRTNNANRNYVSCSCTGPLYNPSKCFSVSKKAPRFRKLCNIQKEYDNQRNKTIELQIDADSRKRKLHKQKIDNLPVTSDPVLNDNEKNSSKLNKYLTNVEDWSLWTISKSRGGLSDILRRRMETVLNAMWNMNEVELVKYEINKEDVPDYYDVIKMPIFMSEIAYKLKTGIYETVFQFVHDFRRIINNVRMYNMATVSYDAAGAVLDEKFTSLIKENIPGFDFSKITGNPDEINVNPKLKYLAYESHTPQIMRRKLIQENTNTAMKKNSTDCSSSD